MNRFAQKGKAGVSTVDRGSANRKLRTAALSFCEILEQRLLFNAGGGWVGTGGIPGTYYSNTNYTGTSFQRTDVRIDFTSGTELPGGTLLSDPTFGSVIPANGFSAAWSGSLMPKFTETYNFEIYGTTNDTSTLIINGTTVATGSGNRTGTYAFTAGQTYAVTYKDAHSANATWQSQLHWSSTGSNPFSEEAIETATPVGANLPTAESTVAAGFANSSLGAGYQDNVTSPFDIYGAIANGSTTVTDVNNTSGLVVGQWIEGTGITAGTLGTYITAINSTLHTITLSEPTALGTYEEILANAPPPLDSNGQPEADFFLHFFSSAQNAPNNPVTTDGVYTVSFAGAAQVYSNSPAIVNDAGSPGLQFLLGYQASGVDSYTGNVASGSTKISGMSTTSNLFLGEDLSGTGIPSLTTITQVNYTGNIASGSTSITNVANTSNLSVGQSVSGIDVPTGATITGISGSTITISHPATYTQLDTLVIGSNTIYVSQAASATHNGETLTSFETINGQTYYPYGTTLTTADDVYNSATGTGYTGYSGTLGTVTNTTTVLMQLFPGSYDNVGFEDTSRNGYGAPGGPTTTTTAGITNLSIMAPETNNGTIDYPTGAIFATPYLNVWAPYTVLRSNDAAWDDDQSDANNYQDWANRPQPSFDFLAEENTPHQDGGAVVAPPWEENILWANETGKDLYIDIPSSASGMASDTGATLTSSYIYQLAYLLKNGDTVNGVAYPGLLPNLNVYIEYGNEVWNSGTEPSEAAFGQLQAAHDQWVQSGGNNSDFHDFLVGGGYASVLQPINLNGEYNLTGIYSSTATFSASGGLDGAGDALLTSSVNGSGWGDATHGQGDGSDDTAASFPSGFNTSGYSTNTTSTTQNREDFDVPTGTTISVNDLQAFTGAGTALGTTSSSEITVAIWQASGGNTLVGSGPLATGTLSSTDSTEVGTTGFYQLNSFTPVALPAGDYAIIASYPTGFAYYNANLTGATAPTSYSGGLVTFPGDNGHFSNSWFYKGSTYDTTTTWSTPGVATAATNGYAGPSFTFNTPNVVTAAGQIITGTPDTASTTTFSEGNYSDLLVYATATGTTLQTGVDFTIAYTNGTTQTVGTSVGGWMATGSPPNVFASYSTYATSGGTIATGNNYVYEYDLPITQSLTVQSITLPNLSDVKILSLVLSGSKASSPGIIQQGGASLELWTVLRDYDISAIFRGVYGNSAMPMSTIGATPNADPRIRPVYEWQEGASTNNGGYGESIDALSAIDNVFALGTTTSGYTPGANYFLKGGGGGWYATDNDAATLVSTLLSQLPTLEEYPTSYSNVPGVHTAGLNITQNILSDVQICQDFGIEDVAYEGGMSVGGTDGGSAAQYTVNNSPSIMPYVTDALDEFEQAGGGMPIVYEGFDDAFPQGDTWAVQNSIFEATSPRLQAYLNAEAQLPPPPLPAAGWTGNVIGPGSVLNQGLAVGPDPTGTWTIESQNPTNTGFDSNNNHTSDEYYEVTTPVSGSATVTAEMTSDQSSGNVPDAGLVMRQSTSDSNAPVVALVAIPSDGEFAMAYRTTESGAMQTYKDTETSIAPPGDFGTPVWMKLVESGNVFTGYVSTNDVTWTTVGSISITSFSTSSYVAGLEQDTNSASLGSGGIVTFENVSAISNEWTLNNTLTASTGSANMGLLNGGSVAYSTSVPTATTFSDSASLSVNSSGVGALQAATNLNLSSSSDYSISLWVNASSTVYNGYAELMELGSYYSTNGEMSLRFNQGGYLELAEDLNGTDAYFGAASSGLPAAGSWVNIVASVNNTNGTAAIYVNGALFASSTSNGISGGTWAPIAITSAPVTLGYRYAASYAGNPYQGLMSDAQIYDGSLTQQDAENIYTIGVP